MQQGGHMQSEGGCAEGPVSAVTLLRAGDMSHTAACLQPLLALSLGMGLPQPLQAPEERAEQFGKCLCTSCKDHSRAGTHPSLGPASSAKGFCLDSANDSIGISPLLASLLRPATARGIGAEGRGRGCSLPPAGSWWGVTGRDQHPLGWHWCPAPPGAYTHGSPQH